jgi:phosphomethylpyrimidine synthase
VTQLEIAKRGEISAEMVAAAERDGVSPELIRDGLAAGTVVLPANRNRPRSRPAAVGAGLSIKVNANVGASTLDATQEGVLARMRAALEAGAEAVMDLSTAGDLDAIRASVLAECPTPVGTVPIYQAAVEIIKKKQTITKMDAGELFEVIEKHGESGVDFITVHTGVTRQSLER